MSSLMLAAIFRSGHGSGHGYWFYVLLPVGALLLIIRLVVRVRRRRERGDAAPRPKRTPKGFAGGPEWIRSDVSLVAYREVRERARSRIFRVGTILILAVVAAGVVIPVLTRGGHSNQNVGVVGSLSASLRETVVAVGPALGTKVTLVDEPSIAAAESALKSGHLDVVMVGDTRLIVNQPITSSDTSTTALLARDISVEVSLQGGLESAGLSAPEALRLSHPSPLKVTSLQQPAKNGTARNTAVYGLILIFVLMTQYGTWILIGVVEEKSSRVVEVLLSALRPVQLLAGKVIGIGLIALAQGLLLVAVALGLGAAIGSDLVKGTAPVEVVTVLVWLVLGYAFYSWVYAAAGSLAERQEHIQTLAFPLQLPILFGYIVSLTSIGSSTPSELVRVLAYLPPTAPFAMTVLVADSAVTWWQFLASALITVGATVVVIRFAAMVYSRAVLRTGRRLRLSEVLATEN